MSKMIKLATLTVLIATSAVQFASASPIVYRPISPSFGGDPLNGNWLLAYGQGQRKSGSEGPGFTIDFPDFGGVPQPAVPTNPTPVPPVPSTGSN